MFKFDDTTEKVLEVCSEEGITYSDILVFTELIREFLGMYEDAPEDFLNLIQSFIKIPEKKKNRIKKKDNQAFMWVVEKLAKEYYKETESELLKKDILKGMYLARYFESFIDPIDIDEEFISELVETSDINDLITIYTILICLRENPDFADNYLETKELIELIAFFHNKLEETDKSENMKSFLQAMILYISNLIYDKNCTGENKLKEIVEPETVNRINFEYMYGLEEEASRIMEEQKNERMSYAEQVVNLQNKISEKEKEIEELVRENERLRKELEKYKAINLLDNKKILVIGLKDKKKFYETILESYGAKCLFIDGVEEHQLVKKKISDVDWVIHIVEHSKHSVHFQLEGENNVVVINSLGQETFKKAVDDLSKGVKYV